MIPESVLILMADPNFQSVRQIAPAAFPWYTNNKYIQHTSTVNMYIYIYILYICLHNHTSTMMRNYNVCDGYIVVRLRRLHALY